MTERLNIVFLWHMHQPLYRDPFSKEYTLPWTRLHGTKDYYDMVTLLEEFPSIHQTFNLVPSLLQQIREYESGTAKDVWQRLSLKPAGELEKGEKLFILCHFFRAHPENMIRPLPRYRELWRKFRIYRTPQRALESFTTQDYLDLQVLFNLAWIDPWLRRTDEALKALEEKGRDYTEEDKGVLFERARLIVKGIIPAYRKMQERGVVELSTSAWYHPILPLLCNTDVAAESSPDIELPERRFAHPEDARTQIEEAVRYHTELFGSPPRGMWPPEGAVSRDALSLIKEAGIQWAATDEAILSLSRGVPMVRDREGNPRDVFLYRPYGFDTPHGRITLFFRDKVLSDLIGFEYKNMDTEDAVEDFLGRLTHIHSLVDSPSAHVVTIILDGENAWEYYREDGRPFLKLLYERLSGSPILRCTTPSELLEGGVEVEALQHIHSGSWINHNFNIWIGHREDNAAWNMLAEAREVAEECRKAGLPEDRLKEAMEELYIAEGSDWFWWYGDEHSSVDEEEFDRLFRAHIERAYQILGRDVPQDVRVPIISRYITVRPDRLPTGFIEPVIDGKVTSYYEWLYAGRIEQTRTGSAMHGDTEEGILKELFFGFDLKNLFFRVDFLKPRQERFSMDIVFLEPHYMMVEIEVDPSGAEARLLREEERMIKKIDTVGVADVVEVSIEFALLGVRAGDRLGFFIEYRDEKYERLPPKGFVIIEVPSEDFEARHWTV